MGDRGTGVGRNGAKPASIGDGLPAPDASMARSKFSWSAAESMTTFVSHASFGTHSMPASERRSARRPSLAASLWSRIRPADSPKAPAFGSSAGRSSVSR